MKPSRGVSTAKLWCFDATVRKLAVSLSVAFLLVGCSTRGAAPEGGDAAAGFVNKVWQVSGSTGVAPGTLYVFLSEGTLLIASPNGKPALGAWKHYGGTLTLVEEGIPYKTDILHLSATEFRIKSNNPGQPVETTWVPAGSPAMSK